MTDGHRTDAAAGASLKQRAMQDREGDEAFVERMHDAWVNRAHAQEMSFWADHAERLIALARRAVSPPPAPGSVEARLREALTRISKATPANTNSHTAEKMRSWCKAVAVSALEDAPPAPGPSLGEAVLSAARDALLNVNKLVAEAAAEGFNYKSGDWPKRLFCSQQQTSQTIQSINIALAAIPDREAQVRAETWCAECGCRHLDDGSCPSPEAQMDRCRAVAAAYEQGCAEHAQVCRKLGEAEADLAEMRGRYEAQKSIVARIWEQLGKPSYEELGGRSIYDLIAGLQAAAIRAEPAPRTTGGGRE